MLCLIPGCWGWLLITFSSWQASGPQESLHARGTCSIPPCHANQGSSKTLGENQRCSSSGSPPAKQIPSSSFPLQLLLSLLTPREMLQLFCGSVARTRASCRCCLLSLCVGGILNKGVKHRLWRWGLVVTQLLLLSPDSLRSAGYHRALYGRSHRRPHCHHRV